MADKQRISYVPLEDMTPKMREEMERCVREGTPRPESSAVRAQVPDCFWFFADAWHNIFRNGVLDHAVKELCRIYVSRSVVCEFCGNQRSIKGQEAGLNEVQVDDLMNFEKSVKYADRPEGGARLRRGDHLAYRHRRCFLGANAQTLQRTRTGGVGLRHRSHLRSAELAAVAQHRPSPGHGRAFLRFDGAWLRNPRGAREIKSGARLLGEAPTRS